MNKKQAIQWYTAAAKQVHDRAIIALAMCYENGDGVNKDEAVAFKWYRHSDAPEVKARLGDFLLRSTVFKNEEEALSLLRQAAEAGSCLGQLRYAQRLLRTDGPEKNLREAAIWFQKAAEKGDALAQYNLAVLLEHGKGCTKDVARAMEWYRKAAANGGVRAQLQLALRQQSPEAEEADLAAVLRKWDLQSSSLFQAIIESKRLVGPFALLTKSNYGQAVRCRLVSLDGAGTTDVVVKSPHDANLTPGLFNEWLALSHIPKHPNVHSFLGICERFQYPTDEGLITRPFSFVTQFEHNGSVEDYITKHGAVSIVQLIRWALDIASGLVHLHNQKLVHRDLAARNVLIGSDLRCVVADFGLLRRAEDAKGAVVYHQKSGDATPLDQAPECVLRQEFSPASDIFSWGLTVFEIATACQGLSPFILDDHALSDEDLFDCDKQYARIKQAADAGFPAIFDRLPADFHPVLKDLMRECLAFEPIKRPSATAVVAVVRHFLGHILLDSQFPAIAVHVPTRESPLSRGKQVLPHTH